MWAWIPLRVKLILIRKFVQTSYPFRFEGLDWAKWKWPLHPKKKKKKKKKQNKIKKRLKEVDYPENLPKQKCLFRKAALKWRLHSLGFFYRIVGSDKIKRVHDMSPLPEGASSLHPWLRATSSSLQILPPSSQESMPLSPSVFFFFFLCECYFWVFFGDVFWFIYLSVITPQCDF